MARPMTTHAIAVSIGAHLRRMEADTEGLNAKRPHNTGRPLYMAGASASGGTVTVTYVTFQGGTKLTRDEARRYLAWLDSGKVEPQKMRHFSIPKDFTVEPEARCEGCDKPFDPGYMNDGSVNVKSSRAGTTVRVCMSQAGSGRKPKQSCTDKALKKAKHCPGCGEVWLWWPMPCTECTKALEYAERKQAEEAEAGTEREWVAPRPGQLLYRSHLPDRRDIEDRLRAALAELAGLGAQPIKAFNAGARVRLIMPKDTGHIETTHSGDLAVQTTERRARLLQDVLADLDRIVTAVHAEGYRAGSDVLGQLARGDIGINEFEKGQ